MIRSASWQPLACSPSPDTSPAGQLEEKLRKKGLPVCAVSPMTHLNDPNFRVTVYDYTSGMSSTTRQEASMLGSVGEIRASDQFLNKIADEAIPHLIELLEEKMGKENLKVTKNRKSGVRMVGTSSGKKIAFVKAGYSHGFSVQIKRPSGGWSDTAFRNLTDEVQERLRQHVGACYGELNLEVTAHEVFPLVDRTRTLPLKKAPIKANPTR